MIQPSVTAAGPAYLGSRGLTTGCWYATTCGKCGVRFVFCHHGDAFAFAACPACRYAGNSIADPNVAPTAAPDDDRTRAMAEEFHRYAARQYPSDSFGTPSDAAPRLPRYDRLVNRWQCISTCFEWVVVAACLTPFGTLTVHRPAAASLVAPSAAGNGGGLEAQAHATEEERRSVRRWQRRDSSASGVPSGLLMAGCVESSQNGWCFRWRRCIANRWCLPAVVAPSAFFVLLPLLLGTALLTTITWLRLSSATERTDVGSGEGGAVPRPGMSWTLPMTGVCWLAMSLLMIRTVLLDPGYVVPAAGDALTSSSADGSITPSPPSPMHDRWCDRCLLWKHARTAHCPKCDLCVDRFDHHCGVLGCCIGRRNHPSFILFLFAAFSSGALVMYQLTFELTPAISATSLMLWIVLVPAMVGILTILLGSLVNICKGLTQRERVRRFATLRGRLRDGHNRFEDREGPSTVAPQTLEHSFDAGCWRNCRAFWWEANQDATTAHHGHHHQPYPADVRLV